MVKESGLVSSFCMWISIFPAPFIEETVFLPMDSLSSFIKYELTIKFGVHFWILYSVLLIYVSNFVPVPHCLGEHSFVVQHEIWHCDVPGSGFHFQYSPGYSGSFLIPHKSYDYLFQLTKKSPWYFNRDCIKREHGLGNIDIFTILILPFHEHGIFFHLLVSSSISFRSFL